MFINITILGDGAEGGFSVDAFKMKRNRYRLAARSDKESCHDVIVDVTELPKYEVRYVVETALQKPLL